MNTARRPPVKRIDDAVLNELRSLSVLDTLNRLGVYWKLDTTYVSATPGIPSRRLNASCNGNEYEFIATNEKWFDTRANKGGGGAVDLTMHIFKDPFRQAIKRLTAEQ